MNAEYIFRFDEPFACTAVHNGHNVCPEIAANFAVSEEVRFREEDPQTEYFTKISNNRIICLQSRFEVDLNRPREKSVYLKPEDAWGLKVRKEELSSELKEQVLVNYDNYYRRVRRLYKEMADTFGSFFVYDIHSYNHHRQGPDAPFDDPIENPEIILGTTNMNERWKPLINQIEARMKEFDFFWQANRR